MTTREQFQVELLKLIISFHNDRSLNYDEMLRVMKEMIADAEEAMASVTTKDDKWFDKWMERQASSNEGRRTSNPKPTRRGL